MEKTIHGSAIDSYPSEAIVPKSYPGCEIEASGTIRYSRGSAVGRECRLQKWSRRRLSISFDLAGSMAVAEGHPNDAPPLLHPWRACSMWRATEAQTARGMICSRRLILGGRAKLSFKA